MRQARKRVLILVLLGLCVPLASAQEELSPLPAGDAAAAIAAEIEIERTLLAEDLIRYDRLVRKRDVAAGRVVELLRSLDTAVSGGSDASPEQIDVLLEQLGQSESEWAELIDEATDLIRQIRERRRRTTLLIEHRDALEGRVQEDGGILSGTWDVVLMPLEQRGVFSLRQDGTLVSGTYRLDGGWTGSLQGTLVNRKVFLVRIDSRLGRMMELEGFISSEDDQVRGSWLNYELAGGDGASGVWSAQRRETD